MTRRRKDPLRTLTNEERDMLGQISRSYSEPASHVARSKIILAVADGKTYAEAAQVAGRHGGGPRRLYGASERERILREVRRSPDPEQDGTKTWSLTTLQRALRQAPDGLPKVSTYTIWVALHEAGWTPQENRTWCDTGTVKRKREGKTVKVIDPDATPKKT